MITFIHLKKKYRLLTMRNPGANRGFVKCPDHPQVPRFRKPRQLSNSARYSLLINYVKIFNERMYVNVELIMTDSEIYFLLFKIQS